MDIILIVVFIAALMLLGVVLWHIFNKKSLPHPDVKITFDNYKDRERMGR